MNKTIITVISLVATLVGGGASLVSQFTNDKLLDMKIEQKVAEALASQIKES